MSYEENPFISEYNILLNRLEIKTPTQALIVPVSAAFFECKNLASYTTEEATRMEFLIVNLATILKKITRVELYIITGRAPELIDKDLEKMRAQGYLEYVLPYDSNILKKNINQMIREIGKDIIVEERLKKLSEKSPLKQYYLTDLGLKLFETDSKDSIEEGNIDFTFLRNDNGWNSITHVTDSNKKRRHFSLIDETDFPFLESFLRKHKEEISDTKIFQELTEYSMIGISEIEGSYLWIFNSSNQLILQTESSFEEVELKQQYPTTLDDSVIFDKLISLGLDKEMINIELNKNSPLGTSVSIEISNSIDLQSVLENVSFEFKDNWTQDLLFDHEDAYLFCRVLLVPSDEEILSEMIFEKIKHKYPEGKVMLESSWEKEISKSVKFFEKFVSSKDSAKKVIIKLQNSSDYWIAEDFILKYINMKFKKNVEELKAKELGNKIYIQCTLTENEFRNEFFLAYADNRDSLENNEQVAVLENLSYPFIINLYSINEKETLVAYFILRYGKEISKRQEIASYLKDLIITLSENQSFTAVPTPDELCSISRIVFGFDLLIAEELVEKHLKTSIISKIIKEYSIDDITDTIEVKIILDRPELSKLFENSPSQLEQFSSIMQERVKLVVEKDVEYILIPTVETQEDADLLLTLRLAYRLRNKLTSYPKLMKLVESILTSIYTTSGLKKKVSIDEASVKSKLADVRKITNFSIEEEEITKDIENMFKPKNSITNINFNYAKNRVSRVDLEFKSDLLEKTPKKNLQHLFESDEKMKITTSDYSIQYRIFAYPTDDDSAVNFLFLKLKEQINKQLWKFSALKDFVKKEAEKYQNKVKSFRIKETILFSKTTIINTIKKFREEINTVLEDIIRRDIKQNFNITRIKLDSSAEIINANLKISLSDIDTLWKQHPKLFYEEVTIEKEIEDKSYSYNIQLLPDNTETAHQLCLLLTANELGEIPRSIDEIKNKFTELYTSFVSESTLEDHPPEGELIDLVRDKSNRKIIVKEEEIEKVLLSEFKMYKNYELYSESAKLLISRRTLKDFEQKIDIQIEPEINLKSELIGDFAVILSVQDKIALQKILELSLNQEQPKDLMKRAQILFDLYLENSEISDIDKQKIKEKKTSILEKIIKDIEKTQ